MPSNHLTLCHPCLLPPSIFPSIRAFSNELTLCIRWPKYWGFGSHSSNEYSELISFRTEWFYLFAVQGSLKSLPQHHNLKTSVLQCSAFFMIQLSHPCWTTGKIVALTRWTFVMSLLLNMLFRFVIAFLPRSKWLFLAAITIHSVFGFQETRICRCFHFPPIYFLWSDGTGCHVPGMCLHEYDNLWNRCYYYLHLTEKETEGQRSYVTCLSSHR